jgi:N utilization substance protein A
MQTPRTEFAQAIKAIVMERGLDPEIILDTIKQAIVAAYKKDAKDRGEDPELFDYDVILNSTNGEAKILAWDHIEPDEEGKVDATKAEKRDVTPPGFGRIAAQTAKQVIHQKIREAEKGAIMGEYSERVGSLVSGMILRFEGSDVRVDLGKTEGIMLAVERVPNERLDLNQRMSFLLKDIIETPRGKQIILSRADSLFVHKLFEREVPEISSGSVIVNGIAREPGIRTKIAVSSGQSGVDPVGSCVGQKGVRVQSVTNELGGERVDIVMFNEDTAEYIKAALSPAEGLVVNLSKKDKTAVVKAPEDQLSLAIGRDGQNARLASKLTNWKIDIEPLEDTKKPKDEKTLRAGDSQEPEAEKVITENTKTTESTEGELVKPAIVEDAKEKVEQAVEEEPASAESSGETKTSSAQVSSETKEEIKNLDNKEGKEKVKETEKVITKATEVIEGTVKEQKVETVDNTTADKS